MAAVVACSVLAGVQLAVAESPALLDLPAIPVLPAKPDFRHQYYMAPDGDDANPGTRDRPFATVGKGIAAMSAGDVLWIKGGTYKPSQGTRIPEEKRGTAEHRFHLWAYPGETAVFDCSGPNRIGEGCRVTADFWHLKGLHFTKTGGCGISIAGDHNIVEQCVASECGDTGIQIWGGRSHNLLLNCDSYKNYDPGTGGQNADGFAVKWSVGPGNMLVGCRAWNNSDDGFDCYCADSAVHLINCWAFRNGYNIWNDPKFTGNGNGFKLGKRGGAHVVFRCAAWDNTVRGFDYNGNTSGVKIVNCTGYANNYATRQARKGKEQNFWFDSKTSRRHWMRNNLSFQGKVGVHPDTDQKSNSWNLDGQYEFTGSSTKPADTRPHDSRVPAVTENDFLSLDDRGTDGARGKDGSLPPTRFLRLAPGSKLIDAGVATGQPFNGKAPDLGAFESASP